jgi:hypothetical protein
VGLGNLLSILLGRGGARLLGGHVGSLGLLGRRRASIRRLSWLGVHLGLSWVRVGLRGVWVGAVDGGLAGVLLLHVGRLGVLVHGDWRGTPLAML